MNYLLIKKKGKKIAIRYTYYILKFNVEYDLPITEYFTTILIILL